MMLCVALFAHILPWDPLILQLNHALLDKSYELQLASATIEQNKHRWLYTNINIVVQQSFFNRRCC